MLTNKLFRVVAYEWISPRSGRHYMMKQNERMSPYNLYILDEWSAAWMPLSGTVPNRIEGLKRMKSDDALPRDMDDLPF